MEPFDTLGLPSPDECPGILGVVVSLFGGIAGLAWLILYNGFLWSFLLIIASAFLGWVSFMYCVAWDRSLPVSR